VVPVAASLAGIDDPITQGLVEFQCFPVADEPASTSPELPAGFIGAGVINSVPLVVDCGGVSGAHVDGLQKVCACGIGHVGDGTDIEIDAAVINLFNLRWLEVVFKSIVHEVGVMLALGRGNTRVLEFEVGLDVAKVLSESSNPFAF